MRLPVPTTAIAAAALLAVGSSAVAAADKPRVNGWYPCAFSSKTDPNKYGSSYQNMTVFECAEIEVPLCYEGLCDSDRLIDVFVKRRRAQNKDGASKALLLLEGGPGYAATGMESRIEKLSSLLDDTVDFYTIDHRGTGRSEFLDCEAAQVLTAGSPGGKDISQDELLSCLKDLNFRYHGQAAGFSTTSVAMDIRAMIDLFMAKQDVYVAGFSYGTYVAQRVLQLNVPQVKGYVFDGVDALSVKGDAVETANSNWNEGLAAPSRRLLEFCFDDDKCPVKFEKRETVLEEVLAVMDKLDKEVKTNKCAQILAEGTGYDDPSVGLRTWMNERVTSVSTRAGTLKMLGHAQRCSDEDAKEMQKIFDEQNAEKEEEETGDVPDELNDVSALLYNVVVFSERWAQPAPTQKQRDAFFYATAYATDDDFDARQYCLFTGSTEPACEELKDELPASHKDTFFYKRDKYYSAPLTLPSHAGALILNGGLDFQTPREFGELLYSKLAGSGQGVMMVNFDYGVHCWGEAVPENTQKPCYYAIIAGLVENDGDVSAIDTSCMAELPDTVFH